MKLWNRNKQEKRVELLTITPPRTGERTLLGVENLLQALAVEEAFSLEIAPAPPMSSSSSWPSTTRRHASAPCRRRRTRCVPERASRRSRRCSPWQGRSSCPCGPSATTTCWTPGRTRCWRCSEP